MARQHGRAVVLGGSMAGLLAARVLSDHFSQVTIVERDGVQDRPESRKGQPQTRHLHGLLANGARILEGFFPGLQAELLAGGAVRSDAGLDARWYQYGGYRLQFESGVTGLLMSRPFLEWHVRRRVLALPNVALLEQCAVQGLDHDPGRESVTGVQVEVRGGETAGQQTILADLVVDATGRGSAASKWLAGLGYAPPPEEKVTIRVCYGTRIYRRRPGDLQGAKWLVTVAGPHERRGAIVMPMEDDRWIITAAGMAGLAVPDDEAGFMAFLRSLPVDDVAQLAGRVEPLSDIMTYRYQANVRRRYEKLRHFPEGFLVLGDALTSFNPIYGQGMSSAAMQAEVLAQLLPGRESLRGLWRPYFKGASAAAGIPWKLTVGEDFRTPGIEGHKPPGTDLINAYMTRVHRATHHDPAVYHQLLRVIHLLDRPESLMTPRMMLRVFGRRRPEGMREQVRQAARVTG